ncbi:hypothetical protein JCM19235_5642 [Vibrio maritimus]|uniref:Uncharacterized protein n=1 Tax=Vibrio maritimus TaxID=990268 RepID=A0A090RRB7_9VIBR|nr:hypothetical protein JCM19235_5642 [Vibrio maritimus]
MAAGLNESVNRELAQFYVNILFVRTDNKKANQVGSPVSFSFVYLYLYY